MIDLMKEHRPRAMKRFVDAGGQLMIGARLGTEGNVPKHGGVVPNDIWAKVYGLGYWSVYRSENAMYRLPAVSERYGFVPDHMGAWMDGVKDAMEDKLVGYPPPDPGETFLLKL